MAISRSSGGMKAGDAMRMTAMVLLLVAVCAAEGSVPSIDELAGHRPQTWFHLIGGNVSKEGLTADLKAIAAAGIGGVQFFHGQMGRAYPWPRTKGQIPCLGDKWDEIVAHAADECARLGLKFEMQNCPGWSMSGGPWIAPDKAMRRLVAFRPGERPAFDADDDFREIGAVTFPAPAGWDDPDPVPTSVATNGDERIFRFGSPVTVRSVELPSPTSLNSDWCYEKWLGVEVSVPDGAGGWRTVVRRDYPRGCWQDDVPVTFSFAAATSDRWRVAFSHRRPVKKVEFVRFHPTARIDGWEALAGWTFRDLPACGAQAQYEATDKRATLVFGHVNMKVRNGPAPEEARGWECDKLDPKGFAANFDGYLGRLMKGALAVGKLKGMVVDSWECGRQSWTERMEEYFERMNGYSPRPHLPALFGYAVGDEEKSRRFLLDWRRTVSRLVEENYYRVFSELGRANGLAVQFETAFQDVIPGDPLRYWKYADIPMCEFWQPFDNAKGHVGSDNFKPVRPCVSAAHLYGKRRVQAEALTSMSLDWDEDFNRFKKVVDRHFARGVTHLVFHTYTHNPQVGEDFLPPGTSFGWNIGAPFLRGQTWWRFMPLFSEYVARCGRELERGLPVIDVLWYLGDDNPYRPDENAPFPKGYKYDYITQDALLERVSVKDGRFALPDGMSYRLLWIPDGTFLLPETERKLAELERLGGRVCRGGLKIDWRSPLRACLGIDPESGVEWYQRRDGDEDIFFLVERDGSSRFLLRDERSGEVRVYDPMTGVVRPLRGKTAPPAAVPVEMRPVAEYPVWAVEREYVGRVAVEGDCSGEAVLDLGKVASWAEVFVNGKAAGTLWAEPYACDISKFLARGENELRVRVTSTWHNRLVHDAALPEQERKTWTIRGPSADAPLRPAGLLGPAFLRRMRWPSVSADEPPCVSGVYPHLAMFNGEGECGTGAVVPWAGDLWVVTYGPHCPVGSTDKLYRIKPDLTQEVFPGSVGGTPANRMIHRETNQLLIGPYVIDAKGNVRVVPVAKMPGRLTGAARHLTDPDKVYVATMETGLYELDMRTLEVGTLIRENGKNDREIGAMLKRLGLGWPAGWDSAPVTHVPGYHGKGLASGFGRVFVANNGEDSEEARRNPFVPSGVLAWWNEKGRDWTTIRRCQFTEITTPDGIYGNEHPGANPVWALGWDAKSVILGVTTNGAEWAYYRLPKASHAYDGAHGWNTEWPRIRDVGLGDGSLLATMHGTFWCFPKGFAPANPNGIRPISTYLKVVGDFCRWGDRIVFGCDDQAKNEFLGKRGLKKDAPRCERSQSNLWFVKPEKLKSFGPPSGEGYVWLDEDVKAGDVSDPYLHAGYETMEFTFTRADGTAVRHELLEDGDWVRVKCLEDAKGAFACFRYGPARCEPPPLASNDPIAVVDDNGKTWLFPNVNGDTNVVCREIATERDLLYVGGVWYEVPADNAGGFSALRPIALADEPVKELRGERGLMYLNGKPLVIDDLWKNGTAAKGYWLWRGLMRLSP